MDKLTIEIPMSLFGQISKQHTQELIDSMNNDYENKYNFVANLNSDNYIYDKYDDNRKAHIIFLDVKNLNRYETQQKIDEKLNLLKNIKDEIVLVVSDKDDIQSLSNNTDLSEIKNLLKI